MAIKTEEHRLMIKSKDIDGKMIELTLSKTTEGKFELHFRHGDSEIKSVNIEEAEIKEIAESIYFFV